MKLVEMRLRTKCKVQDMISRPFVVDTDVDNFCKTKMRIHLLLNDDYSAVTSCTTPSYLTISQEENKKILGKNTSQLFKLLQKVGEIQI